MSLINQIYIYENKLEYVFISKCEIIISLIANQQIFFEIKMGIVLYYLIFCPINIIIIFWKKEKYKNKFVGYTKSMSTLDKIRIYLFDFGNFANSIKVLDNFEFVNIILWNY